MKNTSDWIALFSLIISSSIAFFALIVSGITAFYAYKVYQATQKQLELATSSAKTAEKIANEQLELARQDANNSAEAAKQQKFVSCVEMYIKFYDKKLVDVAYDITKGIEPLHRITDVDNDIKKGIPALQQMIKELEEIHTHIYTRKEKNTLLINTYLDGKSVSKNILKVFEDAKNNFYPQTLPFVSTIFILEKQLNNDEKNKFYKLIFNYLNIDLLKLIYQLAELIIYLSKEDQERFNEIKQLADNCFFPEEAKKYKRYS